MVLDIFMCYKPLDHVDESFCCLKIAVHFSLLIETEKQNLSWDFLAMEHPLLFLLST